MGGACIPVSAGNFFLVFFVHAFLWSPRSACAQSIRASSLFSGRTSARPATVLRDDSLEWTVWVQHPRGRLSQQIWLWLARINVNCLTVCGNPESSANDPCLRIRMWQYAPNAVRTLVQTALLAWCSGSDD